MPVETLKYDSLTAKPICPRTRKNPLWRYSGLLLILLVLLPLRIWRASLESSIWIDETSTLMMINHDVSHMLDLRASDRHPPAYYLALKTWVKAGKYLGVAPSLLWARLMNVVPWVVLVCAAWYAGRRLLGSPYGSLLAWTVGFSAQVTQITKELRGYCLGVVMCFLAFLFFIELLQRALHPEKRRRFLLLAVGYGITGSAAILSHYLTGLVLLLLSLIWLAAILRRFEGKALAAWALSHAIVASTVIPWMHFVKRPIGSMMTDAADWLTAPTLHNLERVFSFWYPFGQLEAVGGWTTPGEISCVLYLALLFGLLIAASLRRKSDAPHTPHTRLIILTGFAVAVTNVMLVWGGSRLGIAKSFHGPRYPLFTSTLWASAIAASAVWIVQSRGWNPRSAWLIVAPWLIFSAFGQCISINGELHHGLAYWRSNHPKDFPAAGETVYVMPEELIAYNRQALQMYTVRTIHQLPIDPVTSDVVVLNLNCWKTSEKSRDTVARAAIEGNLLSTRVTTRKFPPATDNYTTYRLSGYKPEVARQLVDRHFVSATPSIPASALAIARPDDQSQNDGWSNLGVNPDLTTDRWGLYGKSLVRFDRPLEPGDYVIHLAGWRNALPAADVKMALQFGDNASQETVQHPGNIDISYPVRCINHVKAPTLVVQHPTWCPYDLGLSRDRRAMTFTFKYAWIEKAAAK